MELLLGLCGPACLAVATGVYLDRPQRSAVVSALLMLAGIGSVVIEGIGMTLA